MIGAFPLILIKEYKKTEITQLLVKLNKPKAKQEIKQEVLGRSIPLRKDG